MEEDQTRQGFLIVKTFEWMYQNFLKRTNNEEVLYGIPRIGLDPQDEDKQYRGIYRKPMFAWSEELPIDNAPEEIQASIHMGRLEDQGKVAHSFILSLAATEQIYSFLNRPEDHEVIYSSVEKESTGPVGSEYLGYEPTWFIGDHFSAIADSIFFPDWHGTDEGTLFKEYFEQLNEYGLFSEREEAEKFLAYYSSLDWTERGDFFIAGSYLVQL